MCLVSCPGMQILIIFSPSLHMPLNLPHSIVFPGLLTSLWIFLSSKKYFLLGTIELFFPNPNTFSTVSICLGKSGRLLCWYFVLFCFLAQILAYFIMIWCSMLAIPLKSQISLSFLFFKYRQLPISYLHTCFIYLNIL